MGTVVDDHGGARYFPSALPGKVTGIEPIGKEATPSLEKILALNPDLILLPDYSAQNYKQLSNITSTVPIDIYNVKAPIKEIFLYIAQLVGQEEKAEDIFKQYQKRVEEFQNQLGNQLSGLEISVIGHYGNNFWLSSNNAAHFQVFKDIGLPIKPILLKQNEWSTFSIEVIDRYDADVLFIVEDIDGSASFLSQNPLILSLKAVKNG